MCKYLQNFVKGEKKEKRKKKERRKEEERQGGTELISVFFCWAVSWTRPLEQGEEGKDSWREGETRRRGKRASSLRMSLLSPRLVHNLLLQSRVESRRRIFSGAPFLSFGFSINDFKSAETACNNPRQKVHSNFFLLLLKASIFSRAFVSFPAPKHNIENRDRSSIFSFLYLTSISSILSIAFWTKGELAGIGLN